LLGILKKGKFVMWKKIKNYIFEAIVEYGKYIQNMI
jgi:hypothetical protein